MFQNLDVFRLAAHKAQHAAHRQSVIARNIANADTPNYKAQDTPAFQAEFGLGPSVAPRRSHAKHLLDAGAIRAAVIARDTTYQEPNGNTVALETEVLFADQARRDHNRALSVYRSSIDILRRIVG